MTRSDITPGPWSFTEGVHPAIHAQQGRHTLNIAKIIYGFGPEIRANARAIAALPDLLEALEAALPGLESDLLYCERYPQLDGLNQDACLAHKRTRIAKARSALIAAGYQF